MVRGKEKKRDRWWGKGKEKKRVRWWKGSSEDEELAAPLLLSPTDDDVAAAAAALHHPEVTAAVNAIGQQRPRHAVGSSIGAAGRRRRSSAFKSRRRRRSSSISADRRTRRMMENIARRASNAASTRHRQASGETSGGAFDDDDEEDDVVSATGSEETRRIENTRADSEMTCYEESTHDDLPRKQMTPGESLRVAAVILVTAVGAVSYLASFVASVTLGASAAATTTLGVAGGVTVLTVPWVWVSEWRLTRMHAIRSKVNEFRQLAKRFRGEVEILILEEEGLRAELEVLKLDNERLEQLVKKENRGNVDELVELVHENQRILRQMRENIRQVVLQDVVKLVLQSDIDRDGVISQKEANILARRLTISLDVYGIVFDEVKFHRAVGLSPSVGGVMTIVRRLLPDDEHCDDGRMSSSFYSTDSDDDSDEEVAEEEEMDDDDMYDMYYVPVEGQFDRGDADSIQLCNEYWARKGEKAKLMSISPALTRSVKGLYCSVSSRD